MACMLDNQLGGLPCSSYTTHSILQAAWLLCGYEMVTRSLPPACLS